MTTSTDLPQKNKLLNAHIAGIVLAVLFFSYLFGICLNSSFKDTDLWWHLKTGEYVLEHGEVPDVDPFAFTTPVPMDETKKIGLRAHWLGQVILYTSYKIGGLAGVAALRSTLVILPMLIIFVWLIRKRFDPLSALVVISFPALLLAAKLSYTFLRPQGISFTLCLLQVLLLERLREKYEQGGKVTFDHAFWLLPLVTAFWANIHGGYIVGNVMIMVYMTAEIIRFGYAKVKGGKTVHPVFFGICLVAIVASFLNPNGYHLFTNYVGGHLRIVFKSLAAVGKGGGGGGAWVATTVMEYKPLTYFYNKLGAKWVMMYWLFLVLLYLGLIFKYWFRRTFDLTEFFVVGFFVFFSNYYARGVMFALAVLPLFLGKGMIDLKEQGRKVRMIFRVLAAASLILTVILFTIVYKQTPKALKPGIASRWIHPGFPDRMIGFIKEEKIGGPLFNFFDWGGFLIWGLYPEHKVFIDGRSLDNRANYTADLILKTRAGWREALDAFQINFITIPVVFLESGDVVGLAKALVTDDEWALVYLYQNKALFVRNVPENERIIARYGRDKKDIYRQIIVVEDLFIRTWLRKPFHYLHKADALFELGQYGEPKAIYLQFPREAAPMLNRLKEMGF